MIGRHERGVAVRTCATEVTDECGYSINNDGDDDDDDNNSSDSNNTEAHRGKSVPKITLQSA